jgi:dihydroflavonol-4-reductase
MKVFLTGGTGFIGQSLTKALLARGWSVIASVRRPDGQQARNLNNVGAHCTAGDVTDRESLRESMIGADIVIHNAGHYEYGVNAEGKRRMHDINVRGTDNVLGLAQEIRVPRTVYISTVQAYGDSGPQTRDETFERRAPCRTWYEQTKTDAHMIARQYRERGLPLIIACPNGVIGPNDHSVFGYFLRLYLNKMLPPMSWSPGTMFTLVHLDDLAEGIALAAEKSRTGEDYFFAGEPKSFREHLGYWAMKPGAFKIRFWLPAGFMAALFCPLEPLQRMVGLPAFMSRETIRGGATNFNYSSEKAKRELGWTHRSASEMWFNTIDGELELMLKRKRRTLTSLLNPIEIAG